MDHITQEINALHVFFVGWFTGNTPESDFDSGFLARFAEDFLLIPPAGIILNLNNLASSIREGYASNPDFRIAIRNVQVRRQSSNYILATYEEWQRNALASMPPDNARMVSVLFTNAHPLRWLHVHETWMPAETVNTDPFDF